ncbi:MAG: hypothetical protein K2H59_01645 [Muribaculaceae bacterium]|nr:hypothetical protein [Muribaculaceae bacterium]
MNDNEKRHQGLTAGIRSLWVNWALSLGGFIVCIFAPLILSKTLVPFFMLGLALFILVLVRNNRTSKSPFCYKLPYMTATVILWTTVTLVIILLTSGHSVTIDLNGQPYNHKMPFFMILLLAPFATIITAFYMFRGRKCAFCADCEARLGNTVERGFLSKLFTQEADYQTKVLFFSSLALTIIEWTYYFYGYINTNISRRDIIFYFVIPVSMYILTLLLMAIKYYATWAYYCVNSNEENAHRGFSRIRFLVICEDRLWLNIPELSTFDINSENLTIDTPARGEISFTAKFNKFQAHDYFRHTTGITNARIKELYVSSDARSATNIFHFAAFVSSFDDVKNCILTGEWFTLADVQRLYAEHALSPLLSAELNRIHRSVMAWKTYTRDGKRLYKIKHYQPTFRLADMESWDIDFNDPHWLYVSLNNEDRPFFKIRRLWRKYVTGFGE